MMEFYVSGQSLKIFTPLIAADSLNYLTARVHFSGGDWQGASKWLHFRRKMAGQPELVYDIQLDENDGISADKGLNLSLGQWEIYLSGTAEDKRLTTLPVIVTVRESGLIDAPLHELPLSVAEQVDYNASHALLLAQAVKSMADSGEFDGRDGTSLSPSGHFDTAEELAAIITDPAPGDVYSVGTEPPYELYVYDGVNLLWRNHGQLQGVPGEKGEAGAVFIPHMDTLGNLSWLNDAGLENPPTRNIMGPAGRDGEKGESGPGAFEKAQEAGYTGTEETFYAALTMMPYHNRRHLPEGADPITVENGNLADGAVNRAKLDRDVKNITVKNILIPDYAWQEDDSYELYPYRAAIKIEGSGLNENYFADVSFEPHTSELSPQAGCFEEGLYVYAAEPPEEIIEIGSAMFTPVQALDIENEVFASIAVQYPMGGSCTCTDGRRISTAKTASGYWTFAIPYAGDWTVSDGESSETVSITTQGQAETVSLSKVWDGYLFMGGEQYAEITGGWIDGGYAEASNLPAESGIETDTVLAIDSTSGKTKSARTGKKIDVSKYTKLIFTVKSSDTENNSGKWCWLTTAESGTRTDIQAAAADCGAVSPGLECTLDVSQLNDSYYIVFSTSNGRSFWADNVRLE